MSNQQAEITELLQAYAGGDTQAFSEVFDAVYLHLKTIARSQLRSRRPDQTLGATALVHEAYMKLARSDQLAASNRRHFYAIAAMAMRQIVVDQARQRLADKRHAVMADVPVEEAPDDSTSTSRILAIERALEALERDDAMAAQVFTCKYFGGFSTPETAEILDSSIRTVERNWQRAKAFLRQRV